MARFHMPRHPLSFDLPDEWLAEAGLDPGRVVDKSYFHQGGLLLSVYDVEPPSRNPAVAKDAAGFDRARLVSILRAFVEGAELPPIDARRRAEALWPEPQYAFRVVDGYHRFFGSIAAGFTHIPATLPE